MEKGIHLILTVYFSSCLCVQVVAVKQLDRTGMNDSKDFLSEVAVLSQLNHENLVNLVGYCADGDQRLLVYEYMPGGSVDSRLFGTLTLYYLIIGMLQF